MVNLSMISHDPLKKIVMYKLGAHCGNCGYKPKNPGALIDTPDLKTKVFEMRPHPCPRCKSDNNILVRYEGVVRLEPKNDTKV